MPLAATLSVVGLMSISSLRSAPVFSPPSRACPRLEVKQLKMMLDDLQKQIDAASKSADRAIRDSIETEQLLRNSMNKLGIPLQAPNGPK